MSLAADIAHDIAAVLEHHLPASADPLVTAITALDPVERDLVGKLVEKLAGTPAEDPQAAESVPEPLADVTQAGIPADGSQDAQDAPEPVPAPA